MERNRRYDQKNGKLFAAREICARYFAGMFTYFFNQNHVVINLIISQNCLYAKNLGVPLPKDYLK